MLINIFDLTVKDIRCGRLPVMTAKARIYVLK